MDAWIRIGAGADDGDLKLVAGCAFCISFAPSLAQRPKITRYGQATALTPATTKARVSCDHTGGRAAQGPRFDDGQRPSGAREWVAGSCRGSDERKVLCMRGADEIGVECRKRKGLSLRQLQVARVIDGEPVLAGERHDPGCLW